MSWRNCTWGLVLDFQGSFALGEADEQGFRCGMKDVAGSKVRYFGAGGHKVVVHLGGRRVRSELSWKGRVLI